MLGSAPMQPEFLMEFDFAPHQYEKESRSTTLGLEETDVIGSFKVSIKAQVHFFVTLNVL